MVACGLGIFGVGSWGLYPADTSHDSKNNMVGIPPTGPPTDPKIT
jgi:hypothetical protein